MASSMIIPIARVRANIVSILSVKPITCTKKKVPKTDTGREIAETSVIVALRKNTNTINTAKTPPNAKSN